MDCIAKEIITLVELKEFINRCLYYKQIHPHNAESFNATFMNMKINEKVIWSLNLQFKSQVPNILLTDNGKIVIVGHHLQPFYDYVNHDFWIPLNWIYMIKTLFKNIGGWHTTSHPTDRDKCHAEDITTIFSNLNKYLKHLKTVEIERLNGDPEEIFVGKKVYIIKS